MAALDGRLNLEFDVDAAGISEAELQERLRQNASRLGDLLQHPVLDVQVGEDRGLFADAAIAAVPSSMAAAAAAAPDPGSRPVTGPGAAASRRGVLETQFNHPTISQGPSFLDKGSYWEQKMQRKREREEEERRRQEEEQGTTPFRARPVPASTNAPRFQAMRAAAEAARAQALQERQAAAAERATSEVALGRNTAERHRSAALSGKPGGARRRARSAENWRTTLRRSRSPGQRSDDGDDGFDPPPPPPFRARPVPWKVSAPLYDQMLVEEHNRRRERQAGRSRALIRASSLPPRLEGIRARLSGDVEGRGRVHRASTPVPRTQLAKGSHSPHVVNRPLRAEQPAGPQGSSQDFGGGVGALLDAAEHLARDAAADSMRGSTAAAALGPGANGWGSATVYGSNYSLSHFARQAEPPRSRAASAGAGGRRGASGARGQAKGGQSPATPGGGRHDTTEVPDFATLHQKEQERMERRKFQNRFVTAPEPFVFSAPTRARLRQPPMPGDPAEDYRWRRAPGGGSSPSSGPGARRSKSAPRGGSGGPLYQGHERPPPSVVAPPRTTEKAMREQQYKARVRQEQRERERQEKLELQQAQIPSYEMQARVKQAVGIVETLGEKIDRLTTDKRQTAMRVSLEKRRALQAIQERVSRRPLLMEQTDALARARRRALFRVRSTLEAAGLKDVDSHFCDEELDEMEVGAEGYM